MKKLLIASAVALFGLSNAQIAKGTVYLSGTAAYSSTEDNNDDTKTEDFRIIPTVGYFVAPNLAIGVGVGYASSSEKATYNDGFEKATLSAFVVEPFVRKYWTLGDKLYIFGQLSVPMEFGNSKYEETENNTSLSDKVKYNSFGVSVKPGLDYFLNKNWTIEATIGEFGYNTTKWDVEGAQNTNNFNFGLNLANVGIGVKYVFAK
ncbi:outer membrane beta-barrel protein [Chryseobacterium wangxinyae]|uniref:outer membrane beta-barrel protein n=1 Tax=Chryseobacterium sp. CY350 TaxID=2997336 RepID=UPI0022701A3D|nr:outer membrane beta-barrel protein [Chryseobacterium sp. CY350]MCY0978569.1 outer membrane beta-barrel protein [Chryseobacterium sp. CY350]WBZ96339.1 outer membrane beta-barrel protein [Chryseobacterium sp. CY350]